MAALLTIIDQFNAILRYKNNKRIFELSFIIISNNVENAKIKDNYMYVFCHN